MKVGFTGTREGMTKEQLNQFARMVHVYALQRNLSKRMEEFHHGDCIGADEAAHKIATIGDTCCVIHIHPPSDPRFRAYCKELYECVVHEPLPYLERNKVIVDSCDVLIAVPKTEKEALRSGTWSTVRYAIKQNKQVIIIQPSGALGEYE